jgi:malate dehydrogenase (quinone)
MLNVMERCFPNEFAGWTPRLREIIPSLGANLSEEPGLYEEIHRHGDRVLFSDSSAEAVIA